MSEYGILSCDNCALFPCKSSYVSDKRKNREGKQRRSKVIACNKGLKK
jgi:hypothetical protein